MATVVQPELQPLGEDQHVEYHEQSEIDRVGTQRYVPGGVDLVARLTIGSSRPVKGLLAPARCGSTGCSAGDDRRQPRTDVVHAAFRFS
jgi:hypothetical protein